jgi:hypothetical protein
VTGLDLEAAVVRPQIYRVWYAGDTTFVDSLCCFGACYDELFVCVALPIHEEQRELGEEAIVDVAKGGDGLRTGVAIKAAFERFYSPDEDVPRLVVVGCCDLWGGLVRIPNLRMRMHSPPCR